MEFFLASSMAVVSWGPACVGAAVQSAHCCCVGGLRSKSDFSAGPLTQIPQLFPGNQRAGAVICTSDQCFPAAGGSMWMQCAASGLHGTCAPAAELLPPSEGFSARSLPVRMWGGGFTQGRGGTLVSCWLLFPKQWYAEPEKD